METNKEQQHTPEPWSDQTHSSTLRDDIDGVSYSMSRADFEHACKCVNAFEGIKDQAGFIEAARKLNWDRIQVMEQCINACESINPDNPLAVAENLREMYIILKEAEPMFYDAKLLHTKNGVHQEFLEEDIILIQRLKEVLTKIQEGKQL